MHAWHGGQRRAGGGRAGSARVRGSPPGGPPLAGGHRATEVCLCPRRHPLLSPSPARPGPAPGSSSSAYNAAGGPPSTRLDSVGFGSAGSGPTDTALPCRRPAASPPPPSGPGLVGWPGACLQLGRPRARTPPDPPAWCGGVGEGIGLGGQAQAGSRAVKEAENGSLARPGPRPSLPRPAPAWPCRAGKLGGDPGGPPSRRK